MRQPRDIASRSRSGGNVAVAMASVLALCVVLACGIGLFSARAAFFSDSSVRGTSDASTVAQRTGTNDRRANAYSWAAARDDSRVKLRGAVPSEDDRSTLIGMVKAHFPDLKVEDLLKVADGGPPRDQWLGAVSFGLQQLSHMKEGAVKLSNFNLSVAGDARSAEDYAEIKKALAGPLPAGLSIKDDDVRAPIADPFVFTADLGVNALSLSGSVPSERSRKQVRELSRQLFARPGLDDRLVIASGAPKEWHEAMTVSLRALSRLESGKVALSGLAVSIVGIAPDQGTAVAVSYQLRRDLPDRFSTSESIKWKEAKVPTDVAEQVLPRIKAHTRTKDDWSTGSLPPLATGRDGR